MPPATPTKDDPDDGPDCPECEATTEVWVNELSDDEHTYVISCSDCDFEIETVSNLAADARAEQLESRVDDYGQP